MTDQELLDYYTQDFMSVRKNLDFQKQRSKKWLTDALQCQVRPKETDYFWDVFGIEFIENRKINNPYVIIMVDSEEAVRQISNQLSEMGVKKIIGVKDFLKKIRWM